jgi:hypothetical protein
MIGLLDCQQCPSPSTSALIQAIQSRQLNFSDNAAYMLYWIFQRPAFCVNMGRGCQSEGTNSRFIKSSACKYSPVLLLFTFSKHACSPLHVKVFKLFIWFQLSSS